MTQTHDTIRKDSELWPIPQEWEVCRLGDLVDIRRWASPRPIIDFMSKNGFMPWVKIADATASIWRYIEFTNEYITEDGVSRSVVVNPWDLILSNSATPWLPKFMKIKACIHDGWLYLSNYNWIDKCYLYYFFLKFREELASSANWSVFQNLKTDIVKDIKISLPPFPEQQAIASVLWSMDDKIEVLREQNRTLEKIGQTMFYEWFGKYSIEDELPEGWRVGKLGDIIQLLNGFPFKTESYSQVWEYKLVTIWNVNDGVFDWKCNNNILELPEKLPEYCKLQPWDVLLSLTGNVGRVCVVFGENYVLNQRVAKIVPNGWNHIWLAYFLMRSKQMQDLMISISRGTAQMNLSPVETKDLECIVPSKQDILKMETNFQDFYSKILANFEDIYNLIQLRDNLLPRLMSGKVRVF